MRPSTKTVDAQSEERVLTVAQLTSQLKSVVEADFADVWVAGEISNFSRPQSGHCYFTLKDSTAQLRAVIWRGTTSRLKFKPEDGLEVVCRGHLDIYPPRGSYQLVVEQAHLQGVGALELALRKLREKLAQEGLFDAERKQRLPSFPRRIGVVTSPTGAAIRDFLEVLRRRWRGVEVFVFPVRVQGDDAAREIADGIRVANKMKPLLDVLVVGRGGGSLEDLWSFNEEPVVRAIADSTVPTVSAVGHEIDVTLADLAADVRALTPSEAAERIVPSSQDVSELLRGLHMRLQTALNSQAASLRNRLESLASRPALARPLDSVHNLSRQVDDLSARLHAAANSGFRDKKSRLTAIGGKLETLSPLAVLQRGYSVIHDHETGRLITTAKQLHRGQSIQTQFAEGSAVSTVEEIDKK